MIKPLHTRYSSSPRGSQTRDEYYPNGISTTSLPFDIQLAELVRSIKWLSKARPS